MKIRLAKELERESIVDGIGLRAVIWTQGCRFNCLGCHNPKTHGFDGGFLTDTDEIKEELKNLILEDGITFSGGDPFEQVEAVLDIAKYAKKLNLNVWCYTGNTFEELMKKKITEPLIIDLLKQIDILVDGRFVQKEKSLDIKFRGSRNQRIIDVEKSLKRKKVVLYPIDNKINKKSKEEIYV